MVSILRKTRTLPIPLPRARELASPFARAGALAGGLVRRRLEAIFAFRASALRERAGTADGPP
jgi:hypothetical protein